MGKCRLPVDDASCRARVENALHDAAIRAAVHLENCEGVSVTRLWFRLEFQPGVSLAPERDDGKTAASLGATRAGWRGTPLLSSSTAQCASMLYISVTLSDELAVFARVSLRVSVRRPGAASGASCPMLR